MLFSFILAAGVILFVSAIFCLKTRLQFIRQGRRAPAIVVEVVAEKDNENSTIYKPVFQYKTETGKEYTYKSVAGSSPSLWKVGEETSLIYNPDKPEKVRILSYFSSFGLPVILFAIAMILVVIGGGYFFAEAFFKNI